MIDDRVSDCGDVGDDKDGDGTFDGIRGGGDRGGITEVGARQMSAWENWAPVVEEPPHGPAPNKWAGTQTPIQRCYIPEDSFIGGVWWE